MNFPQAFPLIAGKGTPAVAWGDPATCRPSDTFRPDEVYGLPTGARNGFWALDLDIKDGKDGYRALQDYAAGRELPDTYTVKTKSGGFHVYFAWDEAHPVGTRAGVLSGVDVRGHGGFVRAGGAYAVVVDAPIVEAPAWLLELVGRREEVSGESAIAIDPTHPEWANRLALASAFIAGEPPCISGQGGQARIWHVANELTRGFELPIDTALELLTSYNAACVPPWSEGELQHHLGNAANNGQALPGWRSRSFAGFCSGESWATGAANDATPAPTTPRGFSLTTLDLSREPEPPDWVVERIFTADSVNLLVAAPGSLKTWTLFSLGLAMASGTPWLGVYATGRTRKVLIVDWESGERRARRRLRLLTQGRAAEGLFYFRSPWPMTHPQFWKTLRETVEDRGIEVVLYDSLAAGSDGVDENTVQAARPLIEAGRIDHVCHVFIHHAGKSEQKKNAIARGSSAIQAAADTIYQFTDPEGSQATELRCTMSLAKAGDGEQEERVPLRLTNEGGLQYDAEPPAYAGELSTAILERLKSEGAKNVSEMAASLRRQRKAVGEALRALADDGSIVLIERKYRIDSDDLRYGRVLVALVGRVNSRNALAQQAHVKVTDLDSFAAAGRLLRNKGEFLPPLDVPPVGFLGLTEENAKAVTDMIRPTPIRLPRQA